MRYRASLLLILLSLVLGGCAAETPGTLSVVEEFTNYKQIPGVTLAEITAIESLREAGKPFRLGMPEGEACFRRHDGVLDGYTVLLCEWLSELFDMNFIPAIYEWDRLLEGVRSHTIHFTGAITPLMAEGLYYTDPISERTVIIITRDGVSYLPAISRQRPLEYGFIEGTGVNLAVAAISGQSYNSNFYGTYKTAYEDLLNQEIDALLVDSDATAVFTALAGIVIEPLSPAIYHVASLGTANPDLAAIISVVQKYLRTDAGYKLSILQKQGHRLYARNVLYGMLDEGERRYWDLHQNPAAVIPIALSSDNYPISFFNQQMNEWQGISEDILHEIAEITGFTFGTVTSRNDNWSSTLEMLESGAAVLTGELIRTPAREGRFLWADSAYLTDFYALLSDSDLPEVNIGQVNHLRVGLVARTGYEELFHELFPDHPYTVVYGSSYEGFIGLAKGEVDLLMATRNLLLSATSYREMTGIKANLLLSRTYESLFGFNLQGDILCSIISKAQRLIDTDAISDYWIRRVFDYRGQLARAQVPYFIAASVLMVLLVALLGIFLIRNRQMGKRLEQTVNERTAELRHRTEELEVQTRAAEIASQTKSDFLSRMSHEIRTPLNAIIGMTWIAMNEAKEEKLSMALREISAASDHLLGILNDVLDMSKIEAGMFILAEAPFVLRTAMTEVSRIIEQRCMEKKITFADNTADMDDYGVVGDKLRLKQV
ncbi:MAG: transporter substrate-binding domain-containing protein, partial [Symbiobacteriaceae bacterium]|nr:transporter substrate-binding domain-containing protein [Symbiobacteriaceae bacterium]